MRSALRGLGVRLVAVALRWRGGRPDEGGFLVRDRRRRFAVEGDFAGEI